MPIYEYACKKCGKEWELTQKISDPPPKSCPECKSRRVEKLLSLSSFSLKGGGWYSEGYASSGKAKSGTTGQDKSSDTKPKDTKSGESKPKSDKASPSSK